MIADTRARDPRAEHFRRQELGIDLGLAGAQHEHEGLALLLQGVLEGAQTAGQPLQVGVGHAGRREEMIHVGSLIEPMLAAHDDLGPTPPGYAPEQAEVELIERAHEGGTQTELRREVAILTRLVLSVEPVGEGPSRFLHAVGNPVQRFQCRQLGHTLQGR